MNSTPPRGPQARLAAGLVLFIALALTCASHLALAAAPGPRSPHPRAAAPALDNPTTNVLVALAPIDRSSPVEMVALTLDAYISESADGHTLVTGTTTFKLHNTNQTDPISTSVGFPEWAGGALSFDPSQFSQYDVTMDKKNVTFDYGPARLKIGSDVRAVNWYSFTLTLAPDEKKVVSVDFAQDLGSDILPRFTYGLLPSTGWKGPIGSARLTVHFPAPTTGEQFVALDPTVPDFDGQNLNWLIVGADPTADPGVTFIRLSLWSQLLAGRAAAAQNANDPNLHFGLGKIYQQLAATDSPRRDNFLAQAVAELETAARLNPKDVDAVVTLAQLYETRAGPETGPRDARYVALALAEWQNLIGTRADADARQRSAEDSFYLGVDARSRGDDTQALKYLGDAAKFAPNGAGPLYTREHWQSEAQAAHIALAQAALQEGETALALEQAGAAFGSDFTLAPAPTPPAFALDHASVTTTSGQRTIALYLSAYPGMSNDAAQAVAAVGAALNQTGAATASVAASQSEYVVTLQAPFDSEADLQNRLGKLAAAVPQRADWVLVRAIIDPPTLEWSQATDTFNASVHYREEVDLQAAEAPLQNSLNDVSRAIGDLEKTAAGDSRAQLRLALLQEAQGWWQSALVSANVTYEIQPASAAASRWTLALGDRRTLAFDAKSLRVEWYFIGAGGAALGALLLLAVWLLLAGLRRRRRARTPAASQ